MFEQSPVTHSEGRIAEQRNHVVVAYNYPESEEKAQCVKNRVVAGSSGNALVRLSHLMPHSE
jgi:hypothetical protein